MKANSEKSHLLLCKETALAVNTHENIAFNSKIELHFVEHVSGICVKPSEKISAVVRILSFLNQE